MCQPVHYIIITTIVVHSYHPHPKTSTSQQNHKTNLNDQVSYALHTERKLNCGFYLIWNESSSKLKPTKQQLRFHCIQILLVTIYCSMTDPYTYHSPKKEYLYKVFAFYLNILVNTKIELLIRKWRVSKGILTTIHSIIGE